VYIDRTVGRAKAALECRTQQAQRPQSNIHSASAAFNRRFLFPMVTTVI
jgi:hypothetical protein